MVEYLIRCTVEVVRDRLATEYSDSFQDNRYVWNLFSER